MADFISNLVLKGAKYEDFHILGASLGAHVAGYVGHFTHGQIGRITGLDPSGPLFHSASPKDKLDKTDAQFVDIIHTAGKWVGNRGVTKLHKLSNLDNYEQTRTNKIGQSKTKRAKACKT